MAIPRLHFRTVAALFLLAALIPLFAGLGRWQLRRAVERDTLAATLAQAAALPPVPLNADTRPDALQAWRKASAQGYWLHAHTRLIGSRNLQGRPGYWVLTPLQLAGSATALAVLRGWLPNERVVTSGSTGLTQAAGLAQALAQEREPVQVSGELFAHVPRNLELWSLSGEEDAHTDAHLPMLQNIELADYAQDTGLTLMPMVLAQENGPLAHDWPHPPLDADRNRGYALQWFSFCAIATLAFLAIAWRSLHPRHREHS